MSENDGIESVRAVMQNMAEIDMAGLPVRAADQTPPQDPAPPADEPPEAIACHFPLNDIGNAERFITYYGEDLMRVPRLGWFVWTGTHWKKDDDELAVRQIAQTISGRMEAEIQHLALPPAKQRLVDQMEDCKTRYLALDAIAFKDRTDAQKRDHRSAQALLNQIDEIKDHFAKRKDRHFTFAKSTGNSAKIDAMLKESGVRVAHPLDDLDKDTLAVNCASGTLQFDVITDEDGRVLDVVTTHRAHARADLVTKCMPCRYDPGADAPQFMAFLERILPKASIRDFIQRWFGLSMSGVPVQRLAFLFGHGANGKSVLVDLIMRMLADYSATAPIEALTGQSRRGGSDATPELIPLIGARAVRASEPEQGERFKEGMIKSLTSGEPIAVRALHSDFIFLKPFFKLTISGNHKPEIRGTDDGIWRRVLLIPFDVQIPEAERDPDLGDKLWEERDGILNWLVAGLEHYLRSGLQIPDEILAATDDYRRDSDPTAAFLTSSTLVTGADGDFILAKDLVAALRFWLEEEGQTPWGERACSIRIKEKAERWVHPESQATFRPHRRESTGYMGIRFKDAFHRAFADRHLGGRKQADVPRDMGDF